MGLDSFTRTQPENQKSPHTDFDSTDSLHIVNFMLSVEVEPQELDNSIKTARNAVRALEDSARDSEHAIEVIGPAEVLDEEMTQVAEVPDDSIGIVWRHDPELA